MIKQNYPTELSMMSGKRCKVKTEHVFTKNHWTIWTVFRVTSARQDATGMDITSRCTLGDPNKLPEGVPQPARMPYVSDKHPRQTLEVINLLRKHRELCDVVLVVGAKKIYAHRVILSACSPYFRYKEAPREFTWRCRCITSSAGLW